MGFDTKNDDEEAEVKSDIEEFFMDAIGEIQEASVKLNQSINKLALSNRMSLIKVQKG
jgi:hypothetical protein